MRSRSRGAQNGRQPPASVVLHSAPDAGFRRPQSTQNWRTGTSRLPDHVIQPMLERGIAHCSPNEGGSGTCGHGAKSLSRGIGGISPDDSANGSEQRHGPRGDRVSDEGHRGAGGCRGRVHLRRHDQFGWRQRSAVAPAPRVRGRLTRCGKPWKGQDGPKACARSIAQLMRLGWEGEGALTSPDY